MAKVLEKSKERTIGMTKSPKDGEVFKNGELVQNSAKIVDVKAVEVKDAK